jgi:uncharacterized membrane protein
MKAIFYVGLAAILPAIALVLWVIFHPCAQDGNASECIGTVGSLLMFAFIPFVFGVALLLLALFTRRSPNHPPN